MFWDSGKCCVWILVDKAKKCIILHSENIIFHFLFGKHYFVLLLLEKHSFSLTLINFQHFPKRALITCHLTLELVMGLCKVLECFSRPLKLLTDRYSSSSCFSSLFEAVLSSSGLISATADRSIGWSLGRWAAIGPAIYHVIGQALLTQ